MSRLKKPKECNAAYYEALSRNLVHYREQAGLTRREAAEKAGMLERDLWKLERSAYEHPPYLPVLTRLSEVLGVELYQLLEREGQE